MVFKLLFLFLVVGVGFVQLTQGLFSALLMLVLTLCCTAGSIGTHEWVAINWVAPYLRPDYAYAVALAVTFGIPLVLLRLLSDKLITRACMLPLWVDRIGGGFCGLITAFLVVGVMSHAVQNLPFGPSIFGFERVDATNSNAEAIDGVNPTPPDMSAPRNSLILEPDHVAISFGSVMLGGVFSGSHSFMKDHPDIIQTSAWINAVPAQISRFVSPNSINVANTQAVPFIYDFKPGKQASRRGGIAAIPATYEPIEPTPGNEFRMVRVKLLNAARDKNSSHIFTLRQFRLVGRAPQRTHDTQYLPVAIQDSDTTQTINRHIRNREIHWGNWPVINEVLSPRDGNNSEVEIVFELPKGFQPSHIAYKRGAYADVSFENEIAADEAITQTTHDPVSDETAKAAITVPPVSAKKNTGRRSNSRKRRGNKTSKAKVPNTGRGGNVRGITTNQGLSFFGNELPMTLTTYRKLKNVEISGSKLVRGHLVGRVSEQDGGTQPAVVSFDVPDDKRLLQLNTTRLQTRSGLGKALDFASRTIQNYLVEDERGNKYRICGKYAVATVTGQRVVEVQYFKDQFGSLGGVGAFDKIKDVNLRKNYDLVLLFLVEPGAEIVRFTTGGAATRADDLRGEELIAPA